MVWFVETVDSFGELADKVRRGSLTDRDRELLKELALASGWDEEDKVRELLGVIDYAELHRKYLREAHELKEKGDFAGAGRKLWGATTALLKKTLSGELYDVSSWVVWDKLIIDRYITRYGKELKEVLREVLDRAWSLYEFSMCSDADAETFGYLWERVMESLQKVKAVLA